MQCIRILVRFYETDCTLKNFNLPSDPIRSIVDHPRVSCDLRLLNSGHVAEEPKQNGHLEYPGVPHPSSKSLNNL